RHPKTAPVPDRRRADGPPPVGLPIAPTVRRGRTDRELQPPLTSEPPSRRFLPRPTNDQDPIRYVDPARGRGRLYAVPLLHALRGCAGLPRRPGPRVLPALPRRDRRRHLQEPV